MNNFIFENSTKVYFGKGCVKEYLVCLTEKYGERVMLCYGGGSIKKNGIYEEVTEKLKSAGKKVFELFAQLPCLLPFFPFSFIRVKKPPKV